MQMDLDILKRVPSLKLKPEVDFQLYDRKSQYDVRTLLWVVPFG